MKKSYKWETTRKFELVADYSEKLVEKIHYLDGDVIHTGKMEKEENAYIAIYVDGKKIDECFSGTNWWSLIDVKVKEDYKRIWGLNGVAFSPETAEEIEKFLAEVIAAGKNEEVTAFENQKKSEEREEEITRYKRIIELAEKQADIPKREEKQRRLKEYNDIHNEGGEGWLPTIIDKDEYENAKKRIEELKNDN